MRLSEKIGQMLVIGFPAGTEGVAHVRRAIADFSASNFILFSRNIGDPREVFALSSAIRSELGPHSALPPFISVDQEGGTVARLRKGVLPLPGAMLQAAALAGGGKTLGDIRALASIAGRELLALGINWNLAPVADINVNPGNPVINVRSYGDRPETVAEMAAAFAAGLADAGILACAKHFPGHGDTTVDSHLGLPLIAHGLDRLHSLELAPFKRLIANGVATVMTAHVRFPALEPRDLPATLSPRVIGDFLRGELGFKGLVTTDCMEMKAMVDHFPDAAVQAVEAGVDIVEISHSYEAQKAAAEAIARAVQSGRIKESRIDESVDRIAAFKAALPEPPRSWEEAAARLATREEREFAYSFFREGLASLSGVPAKAPDPGALYLDVLPVNLTGAEDSGGETGRPSRVWELLKERGGSPEGLPLSVDPSEAELARTLEASQGRDVVLGLFNAAGHPSQLALAAKLAERCETGGKSLSFVSMRSPYDLIAIRKVLSRSGAEAGREPSFACAFEYSEGSARAVADFLTGRCTLRGGKPVSNLDV